MKNTILFTLCGMSVWLSSSAGNPLQSIDRRPLPQIDGSVQPQECYPVDEGRCFVRMCHDGGNLFIQLVVRDPQLQGRFVMQGLTLYVDPAGRKGRKHAVAFPAADMDMMRRTMPANNKRGGQQGERREPGGGMGLKPLVDNMAFQPSVFKAAGSESLLGPKSALVSHAEDCVVYTCVIPYANLGGIGRKGAVGLGIYSPEGAAGGPGGMQPGDGRPGGPPSGMGGRPGGGMSGPGGMGGGPGGGMRPPAEGKGVTAKAYEQWSTFSLRQPK